MRILAIDSGGPTLGVAAYDTSRESGNSLLPLYVEERVTNYRHTECLMPAVEYVLHALQWRVSNLDAIVVAAGPGSFTGLRVGMATTKGLALAAGCPSVSVNSLEAIARDRHFRSPPWKDGSVLVSTIDARKNRLYAALFRVQPREDADHASPLQRLTPDMDIDARELARSIETTTGTDTPSSVAGPPPTIEFVGELPHDAREHLEHFRSIEHAAAHPENAELSESEHPVRSAVRGTGALGWEKIRSGTVDGPYAGPRYLRGGDVGKPRNYPILPTDQ